MIKVIVLDIDGTLTNSVKEISPLTRQALVKAQEKGYKLVLASGRPTIGLQKFVKELNLDENNGILISYNGAVVSNAQTKEVYFSNLLNKDRAIDLVKHLKKFPGLVPVLEEGEYVICEDCFNDTILYKGKDFKVLQYEARMNSMMIHEVRSLESYLDHDTYKVLTYGNPDYLRTNEKQIAEGFDDVNHMFSADFYYEFTAMNIDKLEAFKKSFDYKPEEVMAFGDAGNDLSMIKYAGLGICMGNGQDEVKKAADYITDDNDHDGIAKALSMFLDIELEG